MKGKLNSAQIEYVLFHLKQHVLWKSKFNDYFVFGTDVSVKNRIVFPSSDKPLNIDEVTFIDDIPILFPISNSKAIFNKDENNNVVFNHDILKSIFYLLSGYQEYNSNKKDLWNRFPYHESIQCKLNFIQKPIVNYYFEWVVLGLKKLSELSDFTYDVVDNKYEFILTHDIDLIDKYTFYNLAYLIKEFIGKGETKISKIEKFKEIVVFLKHYFNFWNKPNPYWNFQYLVNSRGSTPFRQIFFFLEKDALHKDSYYRFDQKRLLKLYNYLKENNCEIGIHGTFASAVNKAAMEKTITNLANASKASIKVNRQHFLQYKLPQTALVHEACDLQEDFTLGFADHEGFRNSYCHPFKLYDFENERMINVWEYPLNVMDGTLFNYRKLTKEDAHVAVSKIHKEIKYFNGIFTLLWHNSYFDEDQFPGMTSFYQSLLKSLCF